MTKIHMQGSAIVLTILAVAALLSVGLAVAQLVPKDFRSSLNIEASINAENAAWAGVEHGLLLLRNQPYYELSKNYSSNTQPLPDYNNRPYSQYGPANASNCNVDRKLPQCRGLDRQLGDAVNQSPLVFESILGPTGKYGLVIWHRRKNVGNTTPITGLDDALLSPPGINDYPHGANINPVLQRDELRRLDIKDVDQLTLRWKPFFKPTGQGCDKDGTSVQLLYTLQTNNDEIVARKLVSAVPGTDNSVPLIGIPPEATTLALRLFVSNPDEQKVVNCFARYSLDSSVSSKDKTVDLGFDVIDSIGESGGVRHKIRVLVNRENGKLLNIFDFGLACEDCQL